MGGLSWDDGEIMGAASMLVDFIDGLFWLLFDASL